MDEHLYNVGSGVDITIRELAQKIQNVVGHQGEIHWNSEMPDGTPRKLMDVSKMSKAGWKFSTSLDDGIQKTYEWFIENQLRFKQVKIEE